MQLLPFLSIFLLVFLETCALHGPELKTSHPGFHRRRLSKLAATDGYRLPGNARPNSYNVMLTFNPNESNFTGEVLINLDVDPSTTDEQTTSLQLNSAIEFVSDPTFLWNDKSECHLLNNTNSFIEITCDNPIEGANQTLKINYTGNLASVDEYGAYEISYKDPDWKMMIATQLEQDYARRLFPCFDEPEYKAPIQLTLKTNKKDEFSNWISNMKVASESEDGDTLTTTFEPTPNMSTYLLAFVITPDFKNFPNQSLKADYDFQIFARPNAEGYLSIALEYGPKLIDLMGECMNMSYPNLGNPRMVFAAIPEFRAGAMENWGLITFREQILIDEGTRTTARDSQYITEVIAHEVAHQWFGDYVTLDWWSEAWLNEGFAQYFQYYLTNQISPDFDFLKQFVVKEKQQALKTDADPESIPLSKNASEVTSNEDFWAEFGDITYIKGASIIKLLNYTLGGDLFKTGLRQYLQNNKNGNPTAKILIDTLQAQAPEEVSLETLFHEWIYESGYPLLDVSLDSKNKVTLQVTKFSSSGSTEESSTTNWWIPLTYTTSDKTDFETPFQWTHTANVSDFSVDFPDKNDSWIIFNLQSIGYYRVNYDQTLWNRIISVLKNSETFSTINVLNRAQLLDDAFNVAKYYQTDEEDGNLYYLTAFKLAEYLKYETEYHPWYTFFTEMQFLLEIIQDPDTLTALKEKILDIISLQLEFPDESKKLKHTDILKQNLILTWACKLGQEKCLKWAQEQFENYKKNTTSIDNNYRDVILCTGLTNASSDDFDKILNIVENSILPFEQTDLIKGLTCASDVDLLNKLLHETINYTSNQPKFSRMYNEKIISNLYTSGSAKITAALNFILTSSTDIEQYWKMVTDPETLLKEIASKIYSQTHIDILNDFVKTNGNDTKYKEITNAAQEAIKIAKKNIEYLKEHSSVLTSVILYDGGQQGDNGSSGIRALFMLTAILSGLSLARWGLLTC